MKKKVIAVLIETENEVNLFQRSFNRNNIQLIYSSETEPQTGRSINSDCEGMYIYIYDLETKDKQELNTWVWNNECNEIYKTDREPFGNHYTDHIYTIIATTDPRLQADGMPGISEQFLKEYIAVNGECEVEMMLDLDPISSISKTKLGNLIYIPATDSEDNLVLSIVKKKAETYTSPLLEEFIALGSTEGMNKLEEEVIQQQINDAATEYANRVCKVDINDEKYKAKSDFKEGIEWARKNLL